MKFEHFFEDLLQEAKGRPMSPEKFEIISQNIGRWMYNYFVNHPVQLSRIPYFSELREYARNYDSTTGVDVDDIEQLVMMLKPEGKSNLMYSYLNQIPQVLKAQEIIKKMSETFDEIGKRVKYYDRPDDYIPVRGRKPKERPEVEVDVLDIEKDTPPIISKNMADISGEMKRRGRKPSVNTLEKMQSKYYKMYDDLEKQLRAMRELSTKIDDYKKYFGK
jgi:hypothetical protein